MPPPPIDPIDAHSISQGTFNAISLVCAVAKIEGAFECKLVCVCRDDLVCGVNGDADGGVITPAICPNATSPKPAC
jgi:hypothetical protein